MGVNMNKPEMNSNINADILKNQISLQYDKISNGSHISQDSINR